MDGPTPPLPAFLLVAAGLAGLVAGGELLVSGAIRLARLLGMTPALIGLTVVAFGTSTPELFVSIAAVLRDAPEVVVGNVVGSNIANVGLILGVAACLTSLPVRFRAVRRDLAWMLVSSILLIAFAWHGRLPRAGGVLLLLFIAGHTTVACHRAARHRPLLPSGQEARPATALPLAAARVAAGLLLLAAGSEGFIDGAITLAHIFGVSELVIGLTLAAVGTSLPELAATVAAVRRRQHELLVGNIIGSNFFNLAMVLGAAALLRPIPLPADLLARDLPVMLLFSLVLWPILCHDGVVRRWHGMLLLTAYIAYLGLLQGGGR